MIMRREREEREEEEIPLLSLLRRSKGILHPRQRQEEGRQLHQQWQCLLTFEEEEGGSCGRLIV
jgi:hypothetical protein